MAAGQLENARLTYEQGLKFIRGTPHRRYLEAVYHNLIQVTLDVGDCISAERYYQEGLPLVELSPVRDEPRFNFLKGRLLTTDNSPDFEQAGVYFEKSIQADEASGAVVLAAQTRFYLAQLLAKKGELERSRSMLSEIRDQFQDWSVPFWQQKCEKALEAIPQE